MHTYKMAIVKVTNPIEYNLPFRKTLHSHEILNRVYITRIHSHCTLAIVYKMKIHIWNICLTSSIYMLMRKSYMNMLYITGQTEQLRTNEEMSEYFAAFTERIYIQYITNT